MSDQHAANFCVKHAQYAPCERCESPPVGLDHIASGAPANELIRGAIRRELESELRGLIMAARMQGFILSIGPEGDNKMVAQVVEGK